MRSRQLNHVILFIYVSSTSQIAHPSNHFEQSIHTSHTSINDPFNDRTRQMFTFLPAFFFLSLLLFLSAYLLLQVVYCTSYGNRVLVASARL